MSQKSLEKYSWLTISFFEVALKKHLDDESIYVSTFKVLDRVTERNQSFWCDVIRVKIDYTSNSNGSKSLNVMLKTTTFSPYMEESLEKYNPFKREMFFHQELMPVIESLLLSNDDKTQLTKKVICIVDERPQPKYLMFEELSKDVFFKVDRRTGLDTKHLKIVLRNLAKLHAASAILPREKLHHHHQPNISEYFKVFHPLFSNCVQSLGHKLQYEEYEGTKVLVEKLKAFEGKMIDKSSEAFMLQQDEFGVLCHGDLWLNNLLFEYDDDSIPVDVRMVEFGLSYFGSPGIDLVYLLFTSSCDDVKDQEIDILLQYYHRKLHTNLIKLKYSLPIPSLVSIHNSFLKCGVIGFMYCCLLLPFRFADSCLDLSCLVLQSKEALHNRSELYNDRIMMKRFDFLLNYFDRKGFLQ